MNNNGQPNVGVYTYLSQVQLIYTQYLQMRTQLAMLDNDLKISNIEFDAFPTQQNLSAVQNTWNKKFALMQQIPQIIANIVFNLTEATKVALSSMQISIVTDNKLSIVLSDNDIASVCSLVEQDSHQLHIKELYKQNCMMQNIPIQLSDIEIRAQMTRVIIPNFDRLKMIIRGY